MWVVLCWLCLLCRLRSKGNVFPTHSICVIFITSPSESNSFFSYLSLQQPVVPPAGFLSLSAPVATSLGHPLFWLRSVISHSYGYATSVDCNAVKVKDHEEWKIGTSLLFRRNCTKRNYTEYRRLILLFYSI